MKTKLTLLTCILFLATGTQAQNSNTPQSPEWKTYIVKGEGFSVSLPVLPAMHRQSKLLEGEKKSRRELLLGSYADGVVYTVYTLENPNSRLPLKDFIAETLRGRQVNLTDISRDDLSGKTALLGDRMVQFFASADRLYRFGAFGAPPDDARLTRFFSSLSFGKTKGAVEVFEGPGLPYKQVDLQDESAPKIYTGKETTRKARLGMKVEPSYTEDARKNGVTGTVVLKCVLSSDGSVKNIRIVSGLPFGLTERAVDAASKIKFIPAQKDGKYVSMWIQLEYNFNLY